MPVPDTSGVPPWATFDDLKNKMNELVGKYNNLLVNLDSLNVVSLTAETITTGTLDANRVTIRSDLTAGAYIQIDGNGMTINDGSTDTFRADITGKVTMTGALIRSKTGYPLVIMDPATDLFGAYQDANNHIRMITNYAGTTAIEFTTAGSLRGRFNTLLGYLSLESLGPLELRSNSGDILLEPTSGSVYLQYNDFSKIKNNTQTLQAALNGRATAGANTGSAGAHNHGISPGTQLAVFGGGFVTWVGAADHVHSQS